LPTENRKAISQKKLPETEKITEKVGQRRVAQQLLSDELAGLNGRPKSAVALVQTRLNAQSGASNLRA